MDRNGSPIVAGAATDDTSIMTAIEVPVLSALPATMRLGAVHLTVASVDRSAAWYQRALGLRVQGQGVDIAWLGDGANVVIVLHEDPRAARKGRHAGLFHYALLYPSREELARAAVRLSRTQTVTGGASDHGTHEAIYLDDPDGNGIELAWDRAPELWPATQPPPAPLDFPSLLSTVAGEPFTEFVGAGLRVGHVHLHVGDTRAAVSFYRDELGLAVRDDWGTAAFMAAGGYHHHLAVNVWAGRGVGGPPAHTAGLRWWTIQLAGADEVEAVRGRFAAHGREITDVDGGFAIRDPWGTALHVVAGDSDER